MNDEQEKAVTALTSSINGALEQLKKHNKQAKKRNRLAEKQYQQSVLNYQQVERQYLIEKSHLQPSFRLSVSEFLTCEPDFVNDPEQAEEAKFVFGFGVGLDERVLRIKLHVKGEAQYMCPSIVIPTLNGGQNEQAYAMTEYLYFVPVERMSINKKMNTVDVYLVYRDKTTLPVIHQFQLIQRNDSALPRWDSVLVDTVYATSHKQVSRFENAQGCATLFLDR